MFGSRITNLKIVYRGVAVAAILGLPWLFLEFKYNARVKSLNKEIRNPAANVLKAFDFKDWLNPYWENEFTLQCKKIRHLDQGARIDFFLFISQNCDFNSYRGLIFQKELGDDRAAFLIKVQTELKRSNQTNAYSLNEIMFWVE